MKEIKFKMFIGKFYGTRYVVASRGGIKAYGEVPVQWPWNTYRKLLLKAKKRAIESLLEAEQERRDEVAEGLRP